MVTPLFLSVWECHRWIPRWHKPYLKTKLCISMLHTTEVLAIFVIFLPILAKIWLPRQRPLDIAIRNVFFGLVGHENPVMSNHILVMSCRNAFICTYSNFSPKIGCHGNAPLSLVYASVIDEFHDGTNPISKPNSAWICCIQLKLWPFLWFLAYFGHNLVAMATPLRPLQSEMSSLGWSTTKTPCYK